jgi:uncharacterized damage-inducible protein DinB
VNAKDAIKYNLDSNMHMFKAFLADLSDGDLLVRPVPAANHAAWQIGHLIAAEVSLIESLECKTAPLPPGFAEKHKKEMVGNDSPGAFLKKQEYLDLLDKVRAGTLAALNSMSDADLAKPTTGSMKDFAPNNGSMFLLVANHVMMHGGQLTVLRRKLGKPILF